MPQDILLSLRKCANFKNLQMKQYDSKSFQQVVSNRGTEIRLLPVVKYIVH